MKKLRQLSLIILATLTSMAGFSQHTKTFPKEINSIKMTAAGVAIVATNDALYGIDKDGKELWKNVKFKKVDAYRIQVLSGSELIVVTGGLMVGTKILNVYNGNIIGGNSDVSEARVIHGTNQLWISTRLDGIHVWDIGTNTEQYDLSKINTPYSIESKGNFMGTQPITYTSESSAILHIGSAQLGEYNLNNGTPIWEFDWKPYKVKKPRDGKGDYPSAPKRGFAIMKLDQETRTLFFPFRNILIAVDSKTGKAKWDVKANKLGQVKDIFIVKQGILVRTAKGVQLIDKQTGIIKWDKPIKIKGTDGSLLIQGKDGFYVVAKGSIEKIDIENRKSTTLTEKIKFKGGESFSSLELINNVVVLSSAQNLVGIDRTSGKINYQVYYKAPGPSVLDVAGSIALAGVAMASTMNSMKVNARAGNKTYYQYTPRMRNSGGSRSTDAGKSLFISTKFKGADANGFGIAKVDKETGKTMKKIVIGVRNPIYVVDENNGIIYYKSDKKELTIKSVL